MKSIEVDDELYRFIVANTEFIGEDASSILRRLLKVADVKLTNIAAAKPEASNGAELVIQQTASQVATTQQASVAEQDSVFRVINKEELAMQRGAVGRFLLILAALHRVHPTTFGKVCEIRGRDRLYFATSEAELSASGSSTKPRQIPDSHYWVITNSNTTRKKMMLTEVAKEMGYNGKDIEKIRDLL